MAIYNADGKTRVCHVDTAPSSEGEAPSKARWAEMKQQGLEIADELSTSGMIGQFLDTMPADPRFVKLGILAIASPVLGIRSFFVIRQGADYIVVG